MKVATKVRPAIDPRMRDRRARVEKDAGRWRRRAAYLILAIMAVGGLFVGLTRSSVLDVDSIIVDGVSPRDRESPVDDVISSLGIAVGDRMVELDLGTAAQGVASLPWVDTATVTREWPGRLRVTISERVPAVWVAFGDQYALIDGRRRVLEIVATQPDDLLELTGIPAIPRPGQHLADEVDGAMVVVSALDQDLTKRSSQVEIVDGEIELVLRNELRVKFGRLARRGDQVDEKVTALRTIVDQVDLAGAAEIDLRVPDSPVVVRSDAA